MSYNKIFEENSREMKIFLCLYDTRDDIIRYYYQNAITLKNSLKKHALYHKRVMMIFRDNWNGKK